MAPARPEPPLVAVVGPTASGKSDLALAIAERFDGEIVNFDSVQVYRGFDIGSAKTPEAERRGIPHHLVDILEPAERCSAGEFARRARDVLAGVELPVLVGGTGFYLRALLGGIFEGPAADEALRERLARSAGRRGRGWLHRLLARVDPEAARRIHANDEPKIVRALEVTFLEGRPMSEAQREGVRPLTGFGTLKLGLDPPRAALYERIDRRTEAMFAGGLVDEVEALLAAGAPREAWPFGALGYRQALAIVEGRMSREEAVADTAQATRRYAKRQRTWFRGQEPDVVWMEGFGDQAVKLALERVAAWLNEIGRRA